MVETFVFGHKSPDSDSITSSLVMANLENELGNNEAKAYRLGNINKETEFILNYTSHFVRQPWCHKSSYNICK